MYDTVNVFNKFTTIQMVIPLTLIPFFIYFDYQIMVFSPANSVTDLSLGCFDLNIQKSPLTHTFIYK